MGDEGRTTSAGTRRFRRRCPIRRTNTLASISASKPDPPVISTQLRCQGPLVESGRLEAAACGWLPAAVGGVTDVPTDGAVEVEATADAEAVGGAELEAAGVALWLALAEAVAVADALAVGVGVGVTSTM